MKRCIVALIMSCCAGGILFAQTDPSLGSNIPGSVARPAPAEFAPPEHEALEARGFPPLYADGLPGRTALRSIQFVPSASTPMQSGVVGVDAGGIDLLARNQKFLAELESSFVGQPMTEKLVTEVARETLALYLKRDRPIVLVQPLFADYTSGRLTVLVVEAVLGDKTAEGARWFSNRGLAKGLRVRQGQFINRRHLLNDLAWLNQNPFRVSDAIFSPGAAPGTTDLLLQTRDRFPVRAYGGIENTGDKQTGVWRWFAGANWGDAFFLGHQLNYQFSAPMLDIGAQPVHAMSYIAPLPWHHRLSVFGFYSTTRTNLAPTLGGPDLEFSGYQWQVSPRYSIPIGNLYGPLQQEFTVGMDWKQTDLGLKQGGIEVPTNETDVVQFMAGYSVSYRDGLLGGGVTQAGFDVYWSPGGIGSRNSTSAFQETNPALSASYVYSALQLGRNQRLPWDFSLVVQARGQVASGPLLSSEQLAIGGYGTVRGYQERVLFGDQGFVLNVELRTPPLRPAEFLMGRFSRVESDGKAGKSRAAKPSGGFRDELVFLGFWDLGIVSASDALPGEKSTYYLTSLGVGARYTMAPNLFIRCDVGFPLVDPDLGFDVSPLASVGFTVGF